MYLSYFIDNLLCDRRAEFPSALLQVSVYRLQSLIFSNISFGRASTVYSRNRRTPPGEAASNRIIISRRECFSQQPPDKFYFNVNFT